MAGLAEFERDLIRDRVRSGLTNARAQGKKLGRQHGQRPKRVTELEPKVLQLVENGSSYREIASQLKISKNTVLDIVKRSKAETQK